MGKSIGSLIAQSSMKHVDLRDPMLGVVDKDRDEEHSLVREVDRKIGKCMHLNKFSRC